MKTRRKASTPTWRGTASTARSWRRRSKVSDSEISRILAGKSRPGLENAFRLARAVGVSLDFLADDSLETDPLEHDDPLSADERELLDLAHGIGAARAARILEIVRLRRLRDRDAAACSTPSRSSRSIAEPRTHRPAQPGRPPQAAGQRSA